MQIQGKADLFRRKFMEFIIAGKKYQFDLPSENIAEIKKGIASIEKLENKKQNQKQKKVAVTEKKQIVDLEKIARFILDTLENLDDSIRDLTAICDESFLPHTQEEQDAVRFLLAAYRAPLDCLTNDVLKILYDNLEAFTPCENQTRLSLLKAVKKYRPYLDANAQIKKNSQNEQDENFQRSLFLIKDKEDKEFQEIFNFPEKDEVLFHDTKEGSEFEYKVGVFEYELNQSIKQARSFLDGIERD